MQGIGGVTGKYFNRALTQPYVKPVTELAIILLFLAGSCRTEMISVGLALLMIPLMLFRLEWTVKAAALLSCILLLNPFFVRTGERFQLVKWIVLFAAALILVLNLLFRERTGDKGSVYLGWLGALGVYMIYLLASSLLFSSLPLISVFKIISFSTGIFVVFVGMQLTADRVDWLQWVTLFLGAVVIGSAFFLQSRIGYLKTEISFQGLMSHPNQFGLIAALFTAILLYRMMEGTGRLKWITLPFIAISAYELVRSNSRTSVLTVLLAFIILSAFYRNKKALSIYIFIVPPLVMLLGLLSYDSISEVVRDFIYKGSSSSILESRQALIDKLVREILQNPLFGNGFGTPVLPYKSYMFALSYPNEQGNMALAILAESGIIGMALFVPWMKKLLFPGGFKASGRLALPVCALFVCMGEMVFFSANGLGVLVWVVIGLYCTERVRAGQAGPVQGGYDSVCLCDGQVLSGRPVRRNDPERGPGWLRPGPEILGSAGEGTHRPFRSPGGGDHLHACIQPEL